MLSFPNPTISQLILTKNNSTITASRKSKSPTNCEYNRPKTFKISSRATHNHHHHQPTLTTRKNLGLLAELLPAATAADERATLARPGQLRRGRRQQPDLLEPPEPGSHVRSSRGRRPGRQAPRRPRALAAPLRMRRAARGRHELAARQPEDDQQRQLPRRRLPAAAALHEPGLREYLRRDAVDGELLRWIADRGEVIGGFSYFCPFRLIGYRCFCSFSFVSEGASVIIAIGGCCEIALQQCIY